MNSDSTVLTEIEKENEKIMMSHIKKIIIEQKTNDAEDVTNKLRRKYDKYNLKKRKYVKKVVQKVLSLLSEENNSNDSVGMEEMFDSDKNGHSNGATATAMTAMTATTKEEECANKNKIDEKRSETVSDDVNVMDEESKDISETQEDILINGYRRKRYIQTLPKDMLPQKRLCVDKPTNEKKSKIIILSDFIETPPLDRTENFSKIIGRNQVMAEVKKCFSVIRLREFDQTTPQLNVLFVAPMLEGKRFLAKAIAVEYKLKFCEINFYDIIKVVATENSKIDFNMNTVLLGRPNQKTLYYFSNLQVIDTEYIDIKNVNEIMKNFLTLISEMKKKHLFVIGGFRTCSKVHSIFDSLFQFDRVIYFNIPNSEERLQIFNHLIEKHSQYDFKVDSEWMVKNSPRYLLRDTIKLFNAVVLEAITDQYPETSESVMKSAIETQNENEMDEEAPDSTSVSNDHKKPPVTEEHFFKGLEEVRKNVSLDQQTVNLPRVLWDDIGSLKNVKKVIRTLISLKLNNIDTGCQGVLLYGPPGCGKTLIAKALASENGFYFISVRGAEFMNKYVGDSQKAVHGCFTQAVTNSPSIIFFDEIDAICSDRTKIDSTVANQVSAALLTEMDGLHKRNVFIIAATNRITIIDKAFLRPGRFSRILYVGLPSATERLDILKTICKSKQVQLSDDVDLEAIANHEKCTNYSGADLNNLYHVAQEIVYQRNEFKADGMKIKIDQESLLEALQKTEASVSSNDLLYYQEYENKRVN